jgi:hypothetical protein
MQEQKSNNNRDNFSKIIKDKLANYTLPVDDNLYEEIEARLNKKSSRPHLWSWISGISTAAAIALLILLLAPKEKMNNYETASPLSDPEKTIREVIPSEKFSRPASPPVALVEKMLQSSGTVPKYAENNVAPEPEVKAEKPTEEILKDNNELLEKPKGKETAKLFPDDKFTNEEPVRIKKRKKQKSIGISLGSGGNLLATNKEGVIHNSPVNEYFGLQSNFLPASEKSNIVLNAPRYLANSLFSTEDFTHINYYPPLSFGLMLRKELNTTFSIESGIVYSFLQSKFSNTIPKREAQLQLHYLGIPVNLNTTILGNRFTKWNLYLSLGGMVEKGILSHYSQTYYTDNTASESIYSNKKIDGLQWSLTVAPGVDYKLNKTYSIYLEPKLNYYFDNNQPVSSRTEHPWVLSVNAGFRFTW